jgi:hypothetical protein
MVLESSTKLLNRFGHDKAGLYHVLQDVGYSVYLVGRWGLIKIPQNNEFPSGDWFCAPNETPDLARKTDKSLKICGIVPLIKYLNPLVGIKS